MESLWDLPNELSFLDVAQTHFKDHTKGMRLLEQACELVFVLPHQQTKFETNV